MRTVSLEQAVAAIPNGASLMIGGFMAVGTPERVIDELVRQGKRDLTVIANDTARPGAGVGKLVDAKAVSKAIVSHIGLNPVTQKQMLSGDIVVEPFLITLKKAERDYSPTTMYRDYAISPTMFHWESQSTQSESSPSIRRYDQHLARDHTIVLFVRERKTLETGVGNRAVG